MTTRHDASTYWRLLLLCAFLAGCSTYSPETRRTSAVQLAQASGWQSLRLTTDSFVLAAFAPVSAPALTDTLTIYIEGDGLAYFGRSQVSLDPTPAQATGLRLALGHAQGAAAYLARPCQYVSGTDARHCAPNWWTNQRFAPEVIAASNQAVEQLKRRFAARHIVLVGYSGGGAVAALLAARRDDVKRLITVAGNLDHAEWTRRHQLPPLRGSLNPADTWRDLQDIPQQHFVGGRDSNVGLSSAKSFAARFPPDRQPTLTVIHDFDHVCCWAAQWPALSPQY